MVVTKVFYEQKQLENLRHCCCVSSHSILWQVMQLLRVNFRPSIYSCRL